MMRSTGAAGVGGSRRSVRIDVGRGEPNVTTATHRDEALSPFYSRRLGASAMFRHGVDCIPVWSVLVEL